MFRHLKYGKYIPANEAALMMDLSTDVEAKSHCEAIVMMLMPIVSLITIIKSKPQLISTTHCAQPNPYGERKGENC